ncbi:MAG: glycosyltransferase family 39 protein [Chloroflexota bacterium]|nr:glycosyltransferase family 39 protein [Chloroflexota bacterium]
MPDRTETRDGAEVWFPALTVEVALYAALALLAFFLRFFLLGSAPLNPDEARQALAAWNFVRGIPDAFTGSPLLFTGNAILFALFGATDTAARFLPPLFGSALVLIPALLRQHLGRAGALIASALFVFSPSLVLFARQVDGTLIAVTCALAAIAFAWRYLDDHEPREIYFAAAFGALALLAAPGAWTILFAAALFVFAIRLRGEQLPAFAIDLRRVALVFVLVFVGVATGFFFHRDGIGAAFDLFGAWLEGLRPGGSLFDPLRLLVLYDPIVLFAGAIALIEIAFAAREEEWHRKAIVLLALWSVVAFVLSSVGGDKTPARVVGIVAPLGLIAGWYLGAWLTRWIEALRAATEARRLLLTQEAPVFALAGALSAFLYFALAEFALRGDVAVAEVVATNLGMPRENAVGLSAAIIVGLILVAFLAVAFLGITTLGWARVRNLAVAFLLAVLTLWTLRQSIMLNFTLTPNVQEWLTPRAEAPNVRDLVADVADASRWRANDSHTLAIVVDDALGADVKWALRDQRYARFVTHPVATVDTPALLLTGDAPAPIGSWISQRYNLEFARVDAPLPSRVRWLMFRDVGSAQARTAVLWLPMPK